MTVMDKDLAWLAGFLDGEGTIGISRTNSKASKTAYLRPHLQAPNTDVRAIEEMARIIGEITGKRPSICISHKGDDRCRRAWRVKVSTQWELLMLLPALIPHLRLKKRQAEIALEFCKRKASRASTGNYRWLEFKTKDEAGYHECLALNARGVPPEGAQIIALKAVKEA